MSPPLRAGCPWLVAAAMVSLALPLLAAQSPFDSVRDILETRCLECHQGDKPKGKFPLTTRAAAIKGGEAADDLLPGDPDRSKLLRRVRLPQSDDDAMPPKKSGPPLTPGEIDALASWIRQGAPWPEEVILAATPKTALPRWDAPSDPAIASIEAFPKSVVLETARDFHKVIAIARFRDAATHDITHQAKFTLLDPSLAQLAGSTLTPLKDGASTLRIEYRGLSTDVPVTVKDVAKRPAVSFQLDVMPVLTAAGCNTGSCHGSARGQDGFHLSLFGFDPQGDHARLTTELAGRRVNLALPDESLLLTKATGEVPHTGGKLFSRDSASCKTLTEWIRNGANYDEGNISLPVRITVEPSQIVMKGPGIHIPFTVRAVYADGTDRDVTSLSTFKSSNDNSVEIDAHKGVAISKNRGEAFLLARFHTFNEGAQAIVIPDDPSYRRPPFPEANWIDHPVAEKLHKLRVIPSELCTDDEFIRRASIDIIGRLPEPEERAAFLADSSPDRRGALVDRLLARKEFTEMWVMKWAELLQIRTFENGAQQVSYKASLNYYNWLRDRIAANVPFDEIIRQILSASGGTFANPATNHFQIEQDALKLSENTAQAFMGTRIQCAQCHNHPFDRWTMNDYYGFAAFFAQVKRKPAEDPRERIIFDGGGEVLHPVTKRAVPPKFLGGPEPDLSHQTRREALAAWLASKDNPWFARNVSNIIWAHFFGSGIVNPVDDMRVSNPPSNPELLDALATRLVSYHFDTRRLVRDICTSRTYQLSSRTNPTNATDNRNFSHALVRRVRAEVLLDCISQVTRTPNKFKGLPLGARAIQIADGNTTNYFLTTFGRATRATVCSCEVKMEPNLSQALHLLNGDTTHQRIRQGKVVDDYLSQKLPPTEIINRLYLATLCRTATDAEQSELRETLASAKNPADTKEIFEDVYWALLNSKEFIFNH